MPNNNQSEEVERIVGEFIRDFTEPHPEGRTMYGRHTQPTERLIEVYRQALTTHGDSEYARGKREERGKQKYNVKEYDEVVYILKSSGGKTYEASIPPLKWYEMGKLGLRTYKALSQENTLKE